MSNFLAKGQDLRLDKKQADTFDRLHPDGLPSARRKLNSLRVYLPVPVLAALMASESLGAPPGVAEGLERFASVLIVMIYLPWGMVLAVIAGIAAAAVMMEANSDYGKPDMILVLGKRRLLSLASSLSQVALVFATAYSGHTIIAAVAVLAVAGMNFGSQCMLIAIRAEVLREPTP